VVVFKSTTREKGSGPPLLWRTAPKPKVLRFRIFYGVGDWRSAQGEKCYVSNRRRIRGPAGRPSGNFPSGLVRGEPAHGLLPQGNLLPPSQSKILAGSDDPKALYHEVGTKTIPPRPFLSTAAIGSILRD
jgi:hypothetical protein